MATSRFKATVDALQGGLKDFSIESAVKNIEGWEEYLSKHDQAGVKTVVQDLGKLKKLLQADEIDSEAVQKLLAKVGKDTVKVAGDGKTAEQKHIQELGEALTDSAEDDLDEDDTDEDDDTDLDDADEDEEDGDEEDDEDDDDVEDDETVTTAKKTAAKKTASPAKKAAKKTPAKSKK